MSLLNESEILDRLSEHDSWSLEENSLVREFQFKDFSSAIGFVVKVGMEAAKLDHHPDILIHSYNKVIIRTSTHSDGGITDKDFHLIDKIENI